MSVWETLRAQLPVRGKLSGRAARASLWSMSELGLSYALRLGSNLVMTRIVMPEAFGLMAMIITLHVALALLSDIGVAQSIIRSPRGEDPRYLRVAWTIHILRSSVVMLVVVGVAGLVWLLAPGLAPAGTVYADPELPLLIAVSSVVMLLYGFESCNQYVLQRRMQLKWLTIQNIAVQVVALVGMVAIAQIEASVWSLLWGMIIGSVFRTVTSHFIPGPRMGFAWDREIADELWHFGKWIIGSSVMTFLSGNADRIFLGAVLDKEHFGFYVIALIWAQAGASVIHRIVTQIGLPVFSDVSRERPEELMRVYHRLTRLVGVFAGLGFVGLFFAGSALILFLYPQGYAQSASFMPFLALAMLREWFSPLTTLLLAQGNSKASAIGGTVEAVATCAALVAGFSLMGIEGALLAVAIAPLVGVLPLMLAARQSVGLPLRDNLMIMGAIVALAAVVGVFLNPLP